jgi:hypothetical protein
MIHHRNACREARRATVRAIALRASGGVVSAMARPSQARLAQAWLNHPQGSFC